MNQGTLEGKPVVIGRHCLHESAKIQNVHPEGLNNDETKRASNPGSRDWIRNRLQQSEKTKFTRIKVSAYFGTLSVV